MATWEGDEDLVSRDNFPKLEDIETVCHGLVTCDTPAGVIRFAHLTVHAFLSGYERLWSICKITKVCLTYLTFKIFAEGPCSTDVALEMRLETYRAAKYVADYWGVYVCALQDSQEIRDAVVSMLQSEERRNAIAELVQWDRRYFVSRGAMEHASEREKSGLTKFVSGQTMMHLLVANRLTTICRKFLEESSTQSDSQPGPDFVEQIVTKDESGLTPFELAVMKCDKETAMLLLKWGADLEDRGEAGRTALATAAMFQNRDMIVGLLDLRADVQTRNEDGETPLHLAVLNGYLAKAEPDKNREVICALLDGRANIEAKAEDGRTPLLCSMEVRNKEAAMILLERGANVRTTWSAENTALHSAVSWGDKDVVFKLLDMGADVNAVNVHGRSVLHRVAMRRFFRETETDDQQLLVRILVERGADLQISLRDKYGCTPWFYALQDEAVELALLNSFSARLKSVCNSTPSVASSDYPPDLRSHLKRLSELSVDSVAASDLICLNLVGYICWFRQDYDMAIAAYTRAYQLDPANKSNTNNEDICHQYARCAICVKTIVGAKTVTTWIYALRVWWNKPRPTLLGIRSLLFRG